MGRTGTGRSLKTARAVLRVPRFLGAHPAGVRTEDVSDHLQKSSATASYLLNSLCQEGYAARDPHGDHAIVVREARGRQGLPKVPGLGPLVRSEAHATAFGKVLLAYGPPDRLPTYVDEAVTHTAAALAGRRILPRQPSLPLAAVR